jgi:hypothetical protein
VAQDAFARAFRSEALESALRSERHDGLRSFLESLMYTIPACVVFLLHWRLARREQAKEAKVGGRV